MKKFCTNASIQPHRSGHIVDIRSHFFAQVCHFVDEGNLGCEKGIRGILGQLRCFRIRYNKRSLYEIERSVDVLNDRRCLLAVSPNNDSIRAHEILNCRSFAEEFWIGNYVEPHPMRLSFFNEFPYSFARTNRHGTLGDYHLVLIYRLSKRTGNNLNLAHVWLSARPLWSSHGNENY